MRSAAPSRARNRRAGAARAPFAALATLALIVSGTVGAASATTVAPPAGAVGSAAEAVTAVATVTLVTGDRVRVVTRPDGTRTAEMIADGAQQSGALVVRHGDAVSVYPTEALPYLRSGAVDPALFEVTTLVDQGMDDESSDELRLMATSPSSPLTTGEEADGGTSPVPAAPPASEATTRAPWLGLVGLRVDKADARRFWAALEQTGGTGTEADFRRGVGRLWLDRRVEASLDRSVGQIGAPAAYAEGLDGTGVTVAVLDTGIDDEHPDVAGKVVAQEDFTGEGTTDDLFGHGTHVASIIAGSGEMSGGLYHGVAPGATLLDGRVLDAWGSGDESWIIAGMEWAAQQGADVANLSLGGWPTDGSDPMSAAVDALTAEYGTLFVIAAGNNGNGFPASNPGTASSALTVGSVGRTDGLSEFSSGAPRLGDAAIKPEISAPGEEIVAAQADGTELGPVVAPGYVALSGTSMATPHVAGSAALLAEQHPDWTADQLKADLVATSAPLDAPVYRAGVGRVDVAAAIATDGLTVDAGTLSFGFHTFPQTGVEPVTRTLTYTNTGAADVTLDLTAALSDVGTGEPLPDGAVKISPLLVTVPAGGSAPVEVTVAPSEVGPGQWSGTLDAVAGDGRTLRTGLAFENEPERYDLAVTVLDLDGVPAFADLFLVNLDTGEMVDSWSVLDPTAPFRVSPGRWSVATFLLTGDGFGTVIAAGVDPDVEVSGDTEVTIDLRTAEPVSLVPDDANVEQTLGSFTLLQETTESEGWVFGLGVASFGPTRVLLMPSDAAELSYEVATSWRVPAVAADLLGHRTTALHPQLLTADDRLDGDRTVSVVPASRVHRGQVALVATDGAEPIDDAVAAAAARGARAVMVFPKTSDAWIWWDGASEVPVIAVPTAEGRRLAAIARAHTVARVHLTGEYAPTRTYDLVHSWIHENPAGTALVVGRRNLASMAETYRTMAGDGLGWQTMLPWGLMGGFGTSVPVPVGGSRISYVSPGYSWDTAVDYGSWTEPDFGFALPVARWWDSTEQVGPRTRIPRTWFAQVMRPAATDGAWSAARLGDELAVWMPLWTDGEGHPGDASVLDDVSWRLTSGGEEIASGTDPWIDAWLPPEEATYRLTLRTSLTSDPTWRLSTATRTTWTFPSVGNDPELDVDPVALLSVSADLPLRSDNTARARRSMTFPVTVTAPEGIAPSRVTSMVVETSRDGGATWHRAEVRRTGAASFSVTVHNGGPGDVALRITARRADGTAVRQEVQAAYRVR